MHRKITSFQICLIAMAVCLNVAGAQIALVLRLPILLDSIGSILTGALMGPWFGLIPSLLSGIILGMTVDIYSLYFAPAGMLVGLMAGLRFKHYTVSKSRLLWQAGFVTLPSAVVSAFICYGLFGGVTSSGSAILVQILGQTPVGLFFSTLLVQIVTEWIDRGIGLFLVICVVQAMPSQLRSRLKGGWEHGRAGRTI